MRDRSRRRPRGVLAALLALGGAPALAGAQQTAPPPTTPPAAAAAPAPAPLFTGPDVIHGRVTDDSAHALAAATVIVTRGPDRFVQQTTTDSTGAYRIRFDQGTGDYLVFVTVPGYRSVRRRVQRVETEHDFLANFQLGRDVNVLATVKVTADKPVRAANTTSPYQVETGASERWNDGVAGAVPPTARGDLSAIAGTMSNVTIGPNGPSILGGGAESNLTTLNGMGLAAGAIPRAARTETRVTGATFDPTRGGFAGANVDVRLGPGDRFYQRRNGFLTLDPAALQFGDPASRALGNSSGGARGSLGADGELVRQALTYNVALDVGRTVGSGATLADADADILLRAGVAPDSVARLVAVAAPLGLGFVARGVPDQQQHDAITWLGRLDDTRDTLSTRALSTYAGLTRDGALGFGPLAAPTTAGERRERTLGGQLTLGSYVGPGRRVLTETRLAASAVNTRVEPYLALPGANVVVRSTTADATGAGTDATSLSLGGGQAIAADDARWTLEGANETVWNARGRRHRFKTLASARVDGLRQQGLANRYGSYSYNSIDDLAAGRPSSFSRTLAQPDREGTAWNAAAALAHQWTPTRWFNLLYGARVEADGFTDAPPRNPALEQALGVTTGAAPTRLHVSPRAGFSYTYNRDKNNGSGSSMSPVGTFYRTTTGTVRGGIGEFRDLLRPGILADASAATGLAGATTQLTCVGAAVPPADFELFAASAANIPTQCLDGSGALAERAPPVTLISPSYDVPHSWRASLDWSTSAHRLLFRLGGLASYDLGQPGTVDRNFSGVRRSTLPGEGGRPLFVSPAGIDPNSGAVSASESRLTNDFGRVGVRVSDLRGYGGQLTAGVSPDVFKFRSKYALYSSLNYTLQRTRRQFRGFDGAGFGDPRTVEWAAGPADARHVVVLSGGVNASKVGTVTLFARAQSGLPFTPLVQGDVNGDGRAGDRAFIPDPATTADAALASQLRALLDGGSPSARRCVRAYLGHVADRNGCRGPWTSSLNVQWRPPVPARWNGRAVPNVYFQNVLAGVDRAVHGENGLRGWGSPTAIDPVLLVPRGYSAAGGFRYDVNSRFADARANRTFQRDPFRVVVDVSFNLSTDYDLQQLRRAVEPVRAPDGWRRRSADSLTAFYLHNTSSIHKLLLEESDSLFLSAGQIAALRRADSVFSARVRAVYRPLATYLAAGAGDAGKSALDSAQATQKAYWKVFWEQPEIADSIITPTQRELMPMFKEMLATPARERPNSQWQFGHAVTLFDRPDATPPKAPGSTSVQVRSGN